MKYDRVITGIFESRPNRFMAMMEITDPDTGNVYVCKCHMKNTGDAISSSTGVESRNGAVLWLKKHKNGTCHRLETTWDRKQKQMERGGSVLEKPLLMNSNTNAT